MRSTTIATGFVALGLLLAAGCGDDDEPVSSGGSSSGGSEEAAGVAPEACDAYVAIGEAINGLPEGNGAGAYIERELVPATEAFAEAAPAELAEQAETMRSAAAAGVEDPAAVEADAAFQAYTEAGAVTHDGCDWETLDVTAVDYAFEGIPDTVPAGELSLALANEGEEEHEIVIFKRNEGVTQSIDELLALPESESESLVTFGAATFAPPGETGYASANLEPGTYFAVCFVPVGGDGPPHFTEGMRAEFEVT